MASAQTSEITLYPFMERPSHQGLYRRDSASRSDNERQRGTSFAETSHLGMRGSSRGQSHAGHALTRL